MTTGRAAIDRLFPGAFADASDADLKAWYEPPVGRRPWVSFNFVSSLDGASAVDGHSGGLGNSADQRILHLLRAQADVLLVGAQTIRAEGYAGHLIGAAAQASRVRAGLAPHPALAMVSGSLRLDPQAPVFTEAPVRPLIYTAEDAPDDARGRLSGVADVVSAGRTGVDPRLVVADLAARGLTSVHSEGGPSLFGAFQDAGLVDELCLSLSPVLASGRAARIAVGGLFPAHGGPANGGTAGEGPPGGPVGEGAASGGTEPVGMALVHVLRSGDMLFLRYRRNGID
jgi:riboflavin biosynthesis pyrimidine reductase